MGRGPVFQVPFFLFFFLARRAKRPTPVDADGLKSMNEWLEQLPASCRTTEQGKRDSRNLIYAQCVRCVDLMQDGSRVRATATGRWKQPEHQF